MTEQERRETETNQYFESRHRKDRARLMAQPHVVYGATVWCTERAGDEAFACGLLPTRTKVGSLDGQPITAPAPVAYGKTPSEACDNFDRLWLTGETRREHLADKRCPECGSSYYWVGHMVPKMDKLVCPNGHEAEVR
jgi:hypothetical protein